MAPIQPAAVTRNGREPKAMISVEEGRDRRLMRLEDFTDVDIAALEETHAPESATAFDDELNPP